MKTYALFGAVAVLVLAIVVGCSTAQRQQVDTVITAATAGIINNAQAVQVEVSGGVELLLTQIGANHPQPARDSATALALWSRTSQQVLGGAWDVAGDAWNAIVTGLSDKLPTEARAVGDLVVILVGRAGTISTPVPLKTDQKQALSIILSGIQSGAEKAAAKLAR